jgi:hypothetical protein
VKKGIVVVLLVAKLGGAVHHPTPYPTHCQPAVVCDWSSPMLEKHKDEVHVSGNVDPLLGYGRLAVETAVTARATAAADGLVNYKIRFPS